MFEQSYKISKHLKSVDINVANYKFNFKIENFGSNGDFKASLSLEKQENIRVSFSIHVESVNNKMTKQFDFSKNNIHKLDEWTVILSKITIDYLRINLWKEVILNVKINSIEILDYCLTNIFYFKSNDELLIEASSDFFTERSEVINKMLSSNMVESTTRIIKLPYSSQEINSFINYLIKSDINNSFCFQIYELLDFFQFNYINLFVNKLF